MSIVEVTGSGPRLILNFFFEKLLPFLLKKNKSKTQKLFIGEASLTGDITPIVTNAALYCLFKQL